MSQTAERVYAAFLDQLKEQAKRRGYSVNARLGSAGVMRIQGEFDVRQAFDAALAATLESDPAQAQVNEQRAKAAEALATAHGAVQAAIEAAALELEGMARAERQRKLGIASVDDFMAAKGRAEGFEQAAQAVRRHKPQAGAKRGAKA